MRDKLDEEDSHPDDLESWALYLEWAKSYNEWFAEQESWFQRLREYQTMEISLAFGVPARYLGVKHE